MVTGSPKVATANVWNFGKCIATFRRYAPDGKADSIDMSLFKRANAASWTLFKLEDGHMGCLNITCNPAPCLPLIQATSTTVHVDNARIQKMFMGTMVSVNDDDRDTKIKGLVRDNAELREIVATLRTMVRKEAVSAIEEDKTVCFFCGKILTPEDNKTSGGSIHAYCRKCHGKVFASIGAK